MTVKQYFGVLKIIHAALIGGLLVFTAVVVFLLLSGNFNAVLPDMQNLFLIIVAVVALGGVYAGNFIYNKQLVIIKQLSDTKEQFTRLRVIIIMRMALLEGPAFLSIIFCMVTGSFMFLVFTLLMVFLFIKITPSKDRIIKELELSEETKKILEDPSTIISNETYN